MYIGLVRHFKVKCSTNMFMTSSEFERWLKQYNDCEVIENKFDKVKYDWHKCYSSDFQRAVKTSKSIYNGEIIETYLLREVPISPIYKTHFKLPFIFWCISGRIAWFIQHTSQLEVKRETEKRVNALLDMILGESDNNILIVCHGFLIKTLQREMKKRGFRGRNIIKPKNGILYLFENQQ